MNGWLGWDGYVVRVNGVELEVVKVELIVRFPFCLPPLCGVI